MTAPLAETSAKRWFRYSAAALVFLVALCTVPYHVPLRPNFSVSWVFGYNNRAGTVLVLAAACLVGVFGGELRREAVLGKPLARSTLRKMLLLSIFTAAALHLLYGRYDGFNEGVYIVDRVKLVLQGERPYRNFSFSYGALLLYAPVLLTQVLPVSVTGACDLFWAFVIVCGVLELYFVLRWTEFAPAAQRRVFLLLGTLTLLSIFAFSTSYTLVRFLTPGFFAMALVRALGKARTERVYASLLLLIGPCAAICLAVSPEMGLAFLAGMVLFLLRFAHLGRGFRLLAFASSLFVTSFVLMVAAHADAFRMMHAVSSGGYNYPLTLAPHQLFLYAAIALTATYVGGRLRRGEGTPLLALCLVSTAMLPGALGRCDLGHAWMDGVGIFLCAGLICTSAPRPANFFPVAVLLVYAALPTIKAARGVANLIIDPVAAAVLRPAQAAMHPAAARWTASLLVHVNHPAQGAILLRTLPTWKEQSEAVDVAAMFGYPPSTVFMAPFGFFAGHTGPYHSAALDDGYFFSTVDMMTSNDVSLKMGELARQPERPLLLQPGSEAACTRSQSAVLAEMRSIMSYPYGARPVHADDVLEPFCAYLRDNYHQQQAATEAHFGYAVWVHNPAR